MQGDSAELMDRNETCRFFGGNRPINAATLYRGIAAGRYPRPVKISPGSSRWLRSECIQAISDLSGRNANCFQPSTARTTQGTTAPAGSKLEKIVAPSVDLEIAIPANRSTAHLIGIYFLFLHETLVYVGGSSNILFRIGQHIRNGDIHFDSFSYLPCALRKIAEIEDLYIKAYRPKHNTAQSSGFHARVTVNAAELTKW